MIKLVKFCLVITFLISCLLIHAQDFQLDLKVRPPSPEAASLGKYQATPVGHFTGIPKISVPLHIVNGRRLSLPISLSYHAGGVKVEEIASMAGLGWSVSAGGSVSRVVRGIPDDHGNIGYLNASQKPSFLQSIMGTPQESSYVSAALSGGFDTQPDIFSFTAGDYSGEFFFDEQGNCRFKSHQNVKIVINWNNQQIVGWTITTPDGTKYYFGKSRDGVRSAADTPSIINNTGGKSDQVPTGITTWFLMDIVDANSNDEINFFYTAHYATTCSFATETWVKYLGAVYPCNGRTTSTSMGYASSTGYNNLIDSIRWANGALKFAKNTVRLDHPGTKRLDQVRVYDKRGSLTKKFDLAFSYFEASGQSVQYACNTSVNEQMKRLKLLSLTETNALGVALPPYQFGYNQTDLPGRFSKSVDSWGYYNGQANYTLIPSMDMIVAGNVVQYSGANRAADPQLSKACILDEIIYPTGATVKYDYEAHVVGVLNYQQVTPIKTHKRWTMVDENGGIRDRDKFTIIDQHTGYVWVSWNYLNTPNCDPDTRGCDLYFEITNSSGFKYEGHDWTGTVRLNSGTYNISVYNDITGFNYNKIELNWDEVRSSPQSGVAQAYAGGVRVARITTTPDQGPAMVTRYVYENGQLVGLPLSGYSTRESQGTCPSLVRTSTSSYPLSTTHGGYVSYHKVKELQGETGQNGYTTYEFSIAGDDDVNSVEYPFPPPNTFEILRGDLIRKRVYSATNVLLKEEKHHYEYHSADDDTHYFRVKGYTVAKTPIASVMQPSYTSGMWKSLVYTVTRTFDGSVVHKDSTWFTYGRPLLHVNPTEESRMSSDGIATTIKRSYSIDPTSAFSYAFDSPLALVKTEMNNRYMIGLPLEERTEKATTTINKLRRDYQLASGDVLPKSTWLAENGSTYNLTMSMNSFDGYGNIRDLVRRTASPETYIWSSDGTELLAAVTNATSSQVFYTGFDGEGTQGDAKTGLTYYSGSSYSIPSNKRPTGSNLKMTFWYYDGTWKFQPEIPYSFSISKAGASRYDEIRVYPADAQMTTYSYKTGTGIITSTDLNNVSTYYKYDEMNRLQFILDEQQNIVKKFEYHYAGSNN